MEQEHNYSHNNFEECKKCTICTVYCPVTPVNPDYPGPKQAGPDGERYRLKKPYFYDEALKYCLNCKRCEVACPSNVKIGDIIMSARIKYAEGRPSLRDTMLGNTDFMGTVATAMAPIVNYTLGLKPVKKIMDATLRIDSHRQFPKYASQRFDTWYRRHAAEKQRQFKKQVAYFHGCYVNYNYPQLGKDLITVLNAAGYGVQLLEKEKCCGVAKISNRCVKEATRDAEINVASIRKAAIDGRMPVVTTSSTCTFTMRDEYPHILGIDTDDIRDSIMLATRFLYDLVDRGEVKLAFRKDYHEKVAYHVPCHMQKLGWTIYSTSLLRMIPGLEWIPLHQSCCGIAGTYGFKKENYNYSQEIGAGLFADIETKDPDLVATDCETCKWQIEMSTSKHCDNPISIIARALDIEETRRLNGVDPE